MSWAWLARVVLGRAVAPPAGQRCDNCRFGVHGYGGFRYCHKRAPIAVPARPVSPAPDQVDGYFPAMRHGDWCGEWEARQ